jgi:hypothetical protein
MSKVKIQIFQGGSATGTPVSCVCLQENPSVHRTGWRRASAGRRLRCGPRRRVVCLICWAIALVSLRGIYDAIPSPFREPIAQTAPR